MKNGNNDNIISVGQFCTLISGLDARRPVCIVCGKHSFVASGAENFFMRLFDGKGVTVKQFCDYLPNPRKEDVEKGAGFVMTIQPCLILAVGGGSTIDVAKLMRHYAKMTDIPLVAIPTTSGTGAEATRFAVCYVDGIKQSICADDILPDYAILLPELTMNNGPYLTACTAFDAFAQAIEAFWNVNATEESDRYAAEAILRLKDNLLKKELTLKERTELMQGAHLAGKAINITKTTAPHALSYTLTSKYDYPHGHAVALTFPYFFASNILCNEENYVGEKYVHYKQKMDQLVEIMGWKQKNTFIEMKKLVEGMGLGYDSKRPFEDKIVETGINIERAKNNPRQLTKQLIQEAVASIRK